jgi:hypothetical protein
MKQFIFLVITIFAASAWAQAPAKEAAKPEPMKAAAKAEPAKHGVVIPKKRRWHEDARHCLDLPTNTEIIKCAEEYL